MKIKEKDIVNHLHENWTKHFPELKGCKKEFSFRNSRADLFSSVPVDLIDLGIRDEDDKLRYTDACIFIEVKYKSEMRDLLFELQKHIDFRDWYVNVLKCFCFIMVISDDFDKDMIKFMQDNMIIMYKLSLEDDNLETLKVKKFEPQNIKVLQKQ